MIKVADTQDQFVNGKKNELLEAHVRFTLKSYQGRQLDKKISDSIDAIFEYFSDVTANDVVDKDQIADTIRSVVFDAQLQPQVLDMVYSVLLAAVDLDLMHKTAIKDVLSKDSYDLFANRIAQSSIIRKKVIARTMESAVYTELISDVLYNGIKGYLVDENFLVKMPGVSSLIKAGKWGLNKSMPGLDASVEATTKPYVHDNIKRTIKLSKTILERELDEQGLKHIADGIWKKLRTTKLSTLTGPLDEQTCDEWIGIGEQLWEDIRTSELANQLSTALSDFWLENYGDQAITEVLNSVGIGREGVIAQLQVYAPAIIRTATDSGYLEARIRAQLLPFYESKEFSEILTS
jgi:hypothetical protein